MLHDPSATPKLSVPDNSHISDFSQPCQSRNQNQNPTTASSSNDGKQQQLEQQQQQHVQGGGAVLVRGMFRRIWRPRYLEIDSDGVLRYYEAVDTSDHGSRPTRNNNNARTKARTRDHGDGGGGSGRRGPDRDISREMQAFALPEDLTRMPVHMDKHGCHVLHSNPNTNTGGTHNNSTKGGNNNGSKNKNGGDKVETETDTDPDHRHSDIPTCISDEADGNAVEVELDMDHVYVEHHNHQTSSSSSFHSVQKQKGCSSSSQDGMLLNHVESWDEIKEDRAPTASADDTGFGAKTETGTETFAQKIPSASESNDHHRHHPANGNLPSPINQARNIMNANKTLQQQQHQDLLYNVPHHHLHSHRPKATMTILSARLIDVKSLRDIHVGLPKGTYGFVFCGRQIFNYRVDDIMGIRSGACGSSATGGLSPVRTKGLAQDGVGLGGDVHQEEEDYYNDLNRSAHHDHFEIRDDICHPLSILSNVDHDYFDSSRDYLCSVSTEEEAKKWVQRLKRAAHLARNKSINGSSPSPKKKRKNKIVTDFDRERAIRSQVSTGHGRYHHTNRIVLDDLTMMDDDDSSSMMIDSISHSRSLLSNSSTTIDAGDGFTIVTRVRGFRVQALGRKRLLGVSCEIHYQIQMLLLSNGHLRHRSERRGDERGSHDDVWTVEQRTVSRSRGHVMKFLNAFAHMSKGENADLPLHKVVQDMGLMGLDSTMSMTKLHKQLLISVENMNKALRIIISDPSLCNTKVAKEFLGVLNHTNLGTSVVGASAKSERLEISTGQSVDGFVKKWLNAKTKKMNVMEKLQVYATLMLQKPNIEALLYFKLTLLVKFIMQGWWSVLFGRTVKVRVDILVAIVVTVYYCGYSAGVSSAKIQHEQILHTSIKSESVKKHSISRGVKIQRKQQILDECSLEGEDVDYNSSAASVDSQILSSPLPEHSEKNTTSCWSRPDDAMFNVRGKTYLKDRIKVPSAPSLFKCRGIDFFLSDNPERNISRLPCVLGGKLSSADNTEDTFLVNFLLPFGNFVMYFAVAKEENMPDNVARVWKNFINGDQMYRDARLKLLPVVVEGPWIVKKAVGPGTAPALLSQSIPLQYYFTHPTEKKRGIYEVDVIITASKIARGILSVVKSHTKHLTIGMAFIIEAATEDELPETVLASCQLHALHLELCPQLPKYYLEEDFAEEND